MPSAKQQRPTELAGNAQFAANKRRDTRHSSTVGIRLCPFLLLLLAVVVCLANGLQVVDVPEQMLITAMRGFVVNHCAVTGRILPHADDTCLLAGVGIAKQDL